MCLMFGEQGRSLFLPGGVRRDGTSKIGVDPACSLWPLERGFLASRTGAELPGRAWAQPHPASSPILLHKRRKEKQPRTKILCKITYQSFLQKKYPRIILIR